MVAFYRFTRGHWTHLRTTNATESPFGALRLRTDAAKRLKKVENATAVILKTLKVAESRFRRLNAAELMRDLALGAEFRDGLRVQHNPQEAAARHLFAHFDKTSAQTSLHPAQQTSRMKDRISSQSPDRRIMHAPCQMHPKDRRHNDP